MILSGHNCLIFIFSPVTEQQKHFHHTRPQKQRVCAKVLWLFLDIYVLWLCIIGGQAAKLRDNHCCCCCCFLLLFCHGSLWQPIEKPWTKVLKYGTLIQYTSMIPHSQFVVTSSCNLAPPTGQSWSCIQVYNFWPNHPIFTFGHAEFNAPPMLSFCAMMDFPPSSFLSKTFKIHHLSQNMIFRPCLTKLIE